MTIGRIAASVVVLVGLAPRPAAQERLVPVGDGECLRVMEAGQGQPILLVPGLLGSAFSFRKLVGPLVEGGYRVIVVEPLGVGASCKPSGADYSLTAQAHRIATAMEVVKLDGAVVVAHADSASIGLRLAYRHPQRVRAVVLLDGGPTETAASPGFQRAMRFSFLIKLFGGLHRIRHTVRSTLMERSADPSWVTSEVVDGYMAAASRDLDGTLRALCQIAKAREPEQIGPHLAELRCPVRLVIGEANRKAGITGDEIELLAKRLACFSIDRVPNAGHFVFEEEPLAIVAAVGRALASGSWDSRIAAAATQQ